MDWAIYIEDSNSEAPIFPSDPGFEALRDLPEWRLAYRPSEEAILRDDLPDFLHDVDGWGLLVVETGLTYDEAVHAASVRGFEGSPIGSR